MPTVNCKSCQAPIEMVAAAAAPSHLCECCHKSALAQSECSPPQINDTAIAAGHTPAYASSAIQPARHVKDRQPLRPADVSWEHFLNFGAVRRELKRFSAVSLPKLSEFEVQTLPEEAPPEV